MPSTNILHLGKNTPPIFYAPGVSPACAAIQKNVRMVIPDLPLMHFLYCTSHSCGSIWDENNLGSYDGKQALLRSDPLLTVSKL